MTSSFRNPQSAFRIAHMALLKAEGRSMSETLNALLGSAPSTQHSALFVNYLSLTPFTSHAANRVVAGSL